MKDDLVERIFEILEASRDESIERRKQAARAVLAIARPAILEEAAAHLTTLSDAMWEKADHVAPEAFDPPTAEERDSAVMAYDFQKAAECVRAIATAGQEADHTCPICAKPFKPDDLCATDITEGTCHAACLEGSPVVNLHTGEPSDGPVDTYTYDEDTTGQEGGR